MRDVSAKKAKTFVNFIGVAGSCRFGFQLFRKCHHGRWNLGLWLWSWDQGSETSMEITQFYSCEKEASINIQHQGDDDCVFDLDGNVRAEFVPRNSTVNSEYCKGLLERLRNDVHTKRPGKWANGFFLHHDNAPCHISLLVRQFLSRISRCVLIHLIQRIWHRATSGSSPKTKWPWKVNVLKRFRRSRQPRKRK